MEEKFLSGEYSTAILYIMIKNLKPSLNKIDMRVSCSCLHIYRLKFYRIGISIKANGNGGRIGKTNLVVNLKIV